MQPATFSLFLLAIPLVLACHSPKEDNPSQALQSFELADGFQIELFASEPLIADPVAMEIDEYGNVFVVEMHGYPLDKSGSGKIKLLRDTDSDGLPDESVVFAESLTLPTGIMRWKKGIIVTDAPDVLYLEDTTGDGKADIKQVLLTGFALSNPQHNLNTPVYGLDNWIYLAHESAVTTKLFPEKFGDRGKEIVFPEKPEIKLPPNANGRNVRFRPDTYQLETLSGESQFGQTFDAWGHHILNSNAHHLFHEVVAARYLERNKNLLVADVTAYMPSYGQGVEIFPITQNPEHQLLTDVGTITSACGVTWYLGDLFPEKYQQVTFVAEPVHNLVHADVISDKGATFSADRLLENREFLASTDSWFRPVNFYIGPDGALYVIDYYRQVIEHPEWMSEDMLHSDQLYNGTDQGRIYRITPKGTPPADFTHKIDLGNASAKELVKYLGHDNIWWRRHAQRLLMDRKPTEVQELLNSMAEKHTSAIARTHALWTLEGLGLLQETTLSKALQDDTPGVRENAVKIAELLLIDFPGIAQALPALTDDPDPKVRFQLLCTLGFLDGKDARNARQHLLFKDLQDEWVQIAALSGALGNEAELFTYSINRLASENQVGTEGLLYKLSLMMGHSHHPEKIRQVIHTVSNHDRLNEKQKASCLKGLAQALSFSDHTLPPMKQEKMQLTRYFSKDTDPELREAALSLLLTVGFPENSQAIQQLANKAEHALHNKQENATWRSDAVQWLAALDKNRLLPLLNGIIDPQEPGIIQKAAIQSLQAAELPVGLLLEKWAMLTPELRNEAIEIFFTNQDRQRMLLDAVAEGVIDPASIDWRHTVALMNSHHDTIRQRSRALLAGNDQNEAEVLQSYQSVLTLSSDPIHGKEVFEQVCASCHQISGALGESFGPDLSTVKNRQPASIMEDILMPNKSIADGYEYWELQQKNGQTLYGIISAETAHTLTLKNAAGQETTISRADIVKLQASTISAMPMGLEKQITLQDMADLLAFLKQSHRLAME